MLTYLRELQGYFDPVILSFKYSEVLNDQETQGVMSYPLSETEFLVGTNSLHNPKKKNK